MGGGRLVFLAGNHDHHLVHRDDEDRLEAALATGAPAGSVAAPAARLLPRIPRAPPARGRDRDRLPDLPLRRRPLHPRPLPRPARAPQRLARRPLLTRTLWAIAAGGPEEPNCIEDYESVTTLLTEWLYIAAQMPHGTHAQQNVFRAAQRAGRFAQALGAPVRGAERLAAKLRDRGQGESERP